MLPGSASCSSPCRHVDAFAVDVVRFDDDVTEIDADPEPDPLRAGQLEVAADHALLDDDRAAHRLDRAVEHGKKAVAACPEHTPTMLRDRRVDQLAQQQLHPRMGASFVGPHQTRIARDVTHHDRGKSARCFLRHGRLRLLPWHYYSDASGFAPTPARAIFRGSAPRLHPPSPAAIHPRLISRARA